jgi:hypothetical protein
MTFIAGVVIGLHVVGWGGIWLAAGPDHLALAGLATLAYSFGLRHAFDADHIAAIDNTTRRLITSARTPLPIVEPTTRAGLPATTVPCLTFRVTTAPAPITAPCPIRTPFRINARAPMKTSSSM